MNDRRYDKKSLDRAGKELVRASRRLDVDKVVDDPYLFAKIRSRIAESQSNEAPVRSRLAFLTVNAQVASVIGLITLSAASIYMITRPTGQAIHNEPPTTSVKLASPSSEVAEYHPVLTPNDNTKGSTPVAASREPRAERALWGRKAPVTKLAYSERKTTRAVGERAFHAVSYANEPADSDNGGRIVRMDLSRSALFALGVNLPLENDGDAPVKTDVLVGRDGLAKAIRVVE